MGAVALQWSLDQTSNDLISIGRGCLRAATSDNVQPLALMACEGFGTIVAMSPESCHKVFLLCDRSQESTTLGFIKATIGYSKNDSAYYLARSDAGQRFLGLAASLSTLGSRNAALILHKLILSTAKSRADMPTSQHLKQLILALDNKLARAGFCESVIGWATIIAAEVAMIGKNDEQANQQPSEVQDLGSPPVDAVAGLTEALSRIARIGGENGTRVRILTPARQAAWFVAFVKWCMGEPPRIILSQSRAFNDESISPVTVEIIQSTGRSQPIHIETYNCADKLQELVKAVPSGGRIRGMVPISTFGQAMMRQRFGPPSDPRYLACAQALLPACRLVRQELRVQKEKPTLIDAYPPFQQLPKSTSIKGQAIPSVEKIKQTIRDYQRLEDDEPVADLPLNENQIVKDAPAVRRLVCELFSNCPCRLCTEGNGGCLEPSNYVSRVAECVSEIMALSLLNSFDSEGVMVYFGYSDMESEFVEAVRGILSSEPYRLLAARTCTVSVSDILKYVIGIMGHDKYQLNTDLWVMSSYHDQTIYPRLLSTQRVQQDDILSIDCVPGQVMWGADRYNAVEVRATNCSCIPELSSDDSDDNEAQTRHSNKSHGNQVEANTSLGIPPENEFPDCKVKWELSFHDSKIEVSIFVPKFRSSLSHNPRAFLDSAVDSFFVNCDHGPGVGCMKAQTPRAWPSESWRQHKSGCETLRIVRCENNEPMRFYCLASGIPAFIRMEACLDCCIEHIRFHHRRNYILC